MIIIDVEHFLDEAGKQYFPQWLEEVAAALDQFEAFVRLRELHPVPQSGECHLLLEFETLEGLNEWSSCEIHRRLMGKLAPLKISPSQVRRYVCSIMFERGNHI